MISIRPSAGTQDTSDAAAKPPLEAEVQSPTQSDEHKRRMPMVWIPVTLCVGLLIAAIYLGGRIVTARSRATPRVVAAPAARITSPVVAPAVVAPSLAPTEGPVAVQSQAEGEPQAKAEVAKAPNPAPKSAPNSREAAPPNLPSDEAPMITPKTGERYIQIGALNHEATQRYVQKLRREKLNPHVAPGPSPDLLRVLIGPFDDRDSITEKKTQLQTKGIDNFIRKY
jgi:cell division septation protein DedD